MSNDMDAVKKSIEEISKQFIKSVMSSFVEEEKVKRRSILLNMPVEGEEVKDLPSPIAKQQVNQATFMAVGRPKSAEKIVKKENASKPTINKDGNKAMRPTSASRLQKETSEIENKETENKEVVVENEEKEEARSSRSVVGKKNFINAKNLESNGRSSASSVTGAQQIGNSQTVVTSAAFIDDLKNENKDLLDKIAELKENHNKQITHFEFQLRAEVILREDIKKNQDTLLSQKDTFYQDIVRNKDEEIALLKEQQKNDSEERKLLEKDLIKEGEDFDMLTEALHDKDKEIEKEREEIAVLRSTITAMEKEIDKNKVIMRRMEKKIESFQPPETNDVCLSARSFSDEILIKLRDDDIRGKGKQINMLTEANTKLILNLDTFEESMNKLQADITERNMKISKLESVIRKNESLIGAKDQEIAVLSGREAAMEVASRQNQKLLLLLQKHETEEGNVIHEKEENKNLLKETKQKYIAALRESADFEALCTKYKREKNQIKNELEQLQWKYTKDVEEVSVKAGEAVRECFFKEQAAQEELRNKRQSHYILLDRLNAAEETMRKSQDEVESLKESQKIIMNRNDDLENRIEEARALIESFNDEKNKVILQCEKESKEKDQKVLEVSLHFEAYEHQLESNGKTIKELRDRYQDVMEKLANLTVINDDKDKELDGFRNRMSEMIKESLSQDKTIIEGEIRRGEIMVQLDILEKEKERIRENFENGELATLKQNNNQLQAAVRRERGGRKRIISRYAKCCCVLSLFKLMQKQQNQQQLQEETESTPNSHANNNNNNKNENKINNESAINASEPVVLDISDALITDEEIIGIKNSLLQNKPICINIIRLATNSITDAGARELANLLGEKGAFKQGCLQKIDLRGNFISLSGIQLLGEALQRNSDFMLEELVFNHDGLIEGMIRDSRYDPDDDGEQEVILTACKIPGFKVSLLLDIRENKTNNIENKDSVLDSILPLSPINQLDKSFFNTPNIPGAFAGIKEGILKERKHLKTSASHKRPLKNDLESKNEKNLKLLYGKPQVIALPTENNNKMGKKTLPSLSSVKIKGLTSIIKEIDNPFEVVSESIAFIENIEKQRKNMYGTMKKSRKKEENK